VQILGQRAMTLGAFVNSKVADYDPANAVLSAQTRRVARRMRLKLRGAAKRAMDAYLAHPAAPKDRLAPLFIVSGIQASHVTVQKALCLPDMRTLLKARAKQAKVAIGGIYKPGRSSRRKRT
jgi:hypothetical protein